MVMSSQCFGIQENVYFEHISELIAHVLNGQTGFRISHRHSNDRLGINNSDEFDNEKV